MSTKSANILIVSLIVLTIIAGVVLYPSLPDQMASHWNLNGEVDGYMGKFWAVFLIPLIMAALLITSIVIPRIDPSKKNIDQFRTVYNLFWVIFTLFMFYIFVLQILWNLDLEFNFVKALAPAFAGLWIGIGYLLKHSKKNWFVGIRTPWTLSNDKIWDKTHILGSKLFTITGVIMLMGLFIKPEYFFIILLLATLISAFVPSVYSYLLFRKG